VCGDGVVIGEGFAVDVEPKRYCGSHFGSAL